MSIHNLSKEEIIEQLQMAEYQKDAMRENLQKIQSFFNIKITKEEMRTDNLYYECDEDYSNVLFHKIYEKFQNNNNNNI